MFASLNSPKGMSNLTAALLLSIMSDPTFLDELAGKAPKCDDPNCAACNALRARQGENQKTAAAADATFTHDAGVLEISGDVAELVGLSPSSEGDDLVLKLYGAAFITALQKRAAKAETSDQQTRANWALHLAKEAVAATK